MNGRLTIVRVATTAAFMFAIPAPALAQGQGLDQLGVRSSMFETYVRPHQWLIFLISRTPPTQHRLHARRFRLRRGYERAPGPVPEYRSAAVHCVWPDRLAGTRGGRVGHHRDIRQSSRDTSAAPARIHESGFADWAVQARMRLARQHGRWPQVFAAFEILPPTQRGKKLIGDLHWNLKGEIGLAREYGWGTMSARTTIEYNRGDHHWDLGETSLEYMRQVSSAGRLFFAIEGGEGGALDEWVFVSAGQWRVGDGLFVKFANSFGLQWKSWQAWHCSGSLAMQDAAAGPRGCGSLG
jgi:hypothetical protein